MGGVNFCFYSAFPTPTPLSLPSLQPHHHGLPSIPGIFVSRQYKLTRNSYNAPARNLLQRRPMVAQCGTAAFLFGAGDVLAQQAIEKKGRNHDIMRTARLSFYGGEYVSPAESTGADNAIAIRRADDFRVLSSDALSLTSTSKPNLRWMTPLY